MGACSIGCLTAAYSLKQPGKVNMPTVQQEQDWGLWLALMRSGVKAAATRESHPLAGLVSVVTPVRNGAEVIEDAVKCVAAQTVPVLEHIIVNDGSDDKTAEVLSRLQHKYAHLTVLTQRCNGAGAARNAGIEGAQGRYIAFLDCDDQWAPRKLERQIRFMEDADVPFTYGDYAKRDKLTGRVLARYSAPDSMNYKDLLGACPIGCLTAAYNQERLGKVYMPTVMRGQDWGLWLALTRNGVIARKYKGLEATYFVHRASLSSDKLHKCLDVYEIYTRYERLNPVRALIYMSSLIWNSFQKRSY